MIRAADGLLLGRKTYEIFAGYWPRITDPDNEIATMLNTMPKHVASTTLDTLEWNVRLDANCIATYCKPATDVGIYVNGTRFDGDPRTIALSDRKEIAFVIGTPPAEIPNTAF